MTMSETDDPATIPLTEWKKSYSPEIFEFLIRTYGFERALSMIDIESIRGNKTIKIICRILSSSYAALPPEVDDAIALGQLEVTFFNFTAFRFSMQAKGISKTLRTPPFDNIDLMDSPTVRVICRTILHNEDMLLDLLLDEMLLAK